MNDILYSSSSKLGKSPTRSSDYNKRRDMNSILSKLEQDDKILAELDSKLATRGSSSGQTVSSGRVTKGRTYLDDILDEAADRSSSLPSLNSVSGGRDSGAEWQTSHRSTTATGNGNAAVTDLDYELDRLPYRSKYSSSRDTPPTGSGIALPATTTTAASTSASRESGRGIESRYISGISAGSTSAQGSSSSLSGRARLNSLQTELRRIEDSLARVHDDDFALARPKPSIGRLERQSSLNSRLAPKDYQETDDYSAYLTSTSTTTTRPLISSAKQSTRIDPYDTILGSKVTFSKTTPASAIGSFSALDGTGLSADRDRECLPLELDKLMAKLDQDNRILAEIDRKLKKVASLEANLSSSLPTLAPSRTSASALGGTGISALTGSGITTGNRTNSGFDGGMPGSRAGMSSVIGGQTSSRPGTALTSAQALPVLPSTHPLPLSSQIPEDLKQAEEVVDSIELPDRGRCKVFIARFNYDPYKQSPNDNPEAEVTLLAGDFILVFGNADEDGFYYGELLDGRRGLVPSNFVEKLTGEDLFEFQATVLYGHNRDGESDTASCFPPEFYDAILSETLGHTNFQHLLAPDDFHRINDYIDLDEETELEEDLTDQQGPGQEGLNLRATVPPPQRLILERQLHKSVLIGWLHPEGVRTSIDHYQIYVDGVLKSTIPAGDRTRALVEGVDSSVPHRISVRAIDRNGRYSRDPGCTVVIGKNIPFAPCCVKASNISSDSALISWIPCNSNFYHVVAVNSVEVKTIRPSVYKHLVTGLAANTLYRVSVRAKPGKLLCSDEKNPKKLELLTTFVDFRTLPKSLPDPPVDIQIEQGPQEGTLLVTWLPITLNQFGTSNNCPVTGYAVFAGHKKLAEIDSPTGDHALLNIANLEALHKKSVTVRTKSGENLSQDSMACQIPDDLLKLPPNQLINKRNYVPSSDTESDAEIRNLAQRISCRSKEFEQQYELDSAVIQQNQIFNENRQKMLANRQQNLRAQSRQHAAAQQQRLIHVTSDALGRVTIPAIEVNKAMGENYSEEEFEQGIKRQAHRQRSLGLSPLPPQRTRVLSEFERSNFGPFNMAGSHRRAVPVVPREHGVRWFVALFDYDPLSMSPNPDAAEEELPFQEGQLIKIYGDKDADGFYRGEANGRIGYVPCNMVSEVQYDPESDPRYRHNPNDPWAHLPIRKMIALYDYDPQELSPNFDSEMELAFRTGDIVYTYGEMDEDGFFMGEVNGVRGLVPSNFLSDAGPVGELSAAAGVAAANVRHAKFNAQARAAGQLQAQQQALLGPLNNGQLGQSGLLGTVNQYGGPQQNFNLQGQQQFGVNPLQTQQQVMAQQQQQQQAHMLNQQQQLSQQQGTQAMLVGGQMQTVGPGGMLNQSQPGMLINTGLNQTGMLGQGQGQLQQGSHQQSGMFGSQLHNAQQQQQQQQQQQAHHQQALLAQQQGQRGLRPQLQQGQMGQQGQSLFSGANQLGQGNNRQNQRPNSLDLNNGIGPTRFGLGTQNTGVGGQFGVNQQQQQQQSTSVLGSLFASGKKILEDATTPLGARGPFVHPNQPHQPVLGHQQQTGMGMMGQQATGPQPPPGPLGAPINPQGPLNAAGAQQIAQQMNYGPNYPGGQQAGQNFNGQMGMGQPGQPGQPGLMNTMKSLFKL